MPLEEDLLSLKSEDEDVFAATALSGEGDFLTDLSEVLICSSFFIGSGMELDEADFGRGTVFTGFNLANAAKPSGFVCCVEPRVMDELEFLPNFFICERRIALSSSWYFLGEGFDGFGGAFLP